MRKILKVIRKIALFAREPAKDILPLGDKAAESLGEQVGITVGKASLRLLGVFGTAGESPFAPEHPSETEKPCGSTAKHSGGCCQRREKRASAEVIGAPSAACPETVLRQHLLTLWDILFVMGCQSRCDLFIRKLRFCRELPRRRKDVVRRIHGGAVSGNDGCGISSAEGCRRKQKSNTEKQQCRAVLKEPYQFSHL